MIKKIAILGVDLIVILFLGLILVIAFTGGFSFVLGSLKLQAYNFKNPLIILISALILRRFLTGSFFNGFIGFTLLKEIGTTLRIFSDKLTSRFLTSSLFRKQVIIGLFLLFFITVFIVIWEPTNRGLLCHSYNNTEWSGSPIMTTNDRTLDLTRIEREIPSLITNYSVQWTGMILIPTSGKYQFTTISDDGSELYIDDQLVVDNTGFHGVQERIGTIRLRSGFHAIKIRYMQGEGIAEFKAYWRRPGKKPEILSYAPLFSEELTNFAHIWIFWIKKAVLLILGAFWSISILLLSIEVATRSSQKTHFWNRLSPLSLKLFAFCLISGLALNIFLSSFSERTTLYFTWYFLTSPAHERSDSWRHMQTALEYFENHRDAALYSEVFFNQGIKFQYPPSSLLLIKLLKQFSANNLISSANFLAWLGIMITIILIERIFSLSIQQYMTEEKPLVGERIARVGLAVCFTLTFYPVVRSFQAGQIQAWIYFFFVLAVWAWMTNNKGLSGVCIGLICIIKPQLGLLAIWGSLRKQWRFVAGVMVMAGIIGIISVSVFGIKNHLDYLEVLSYMSKHGESYYPNQSVNGLLHRLLFNGPNVTWTGSSFAPYNLWVYIGTMVSSFVLVGAALFWKRGQHDHAEILDFLSASLSFTIASPIAWEHHYNVMLPMFAIALPMTLASRFKQRGIVVIGVSFLLCSNFYPITNRLADTWLNFFQSYLFFGAALFLVYLYWLRDVQERGNLNKKEL